MKRHHDIHQGWHKIYAGRYGVMPKEGGHGSGFGNGSDRELAPFLSGQFRKALEDHIVPITRQDPACSVELLTKIPFFLKSNEQITVKVRVRNDGQERIPAQDGLVVHARWIDLYRDQKAGEPMYAPLPRDLAPGESCEVALVIIPHKRYRLYQLQIGLLEEGWGWKPRVIKNCHRHWHLIH